MTNSTRLIGLIMTAALWAGMVAAQDLSSSDWSNELPPDLPLPSVGSDGTAMPSTQPAANISEPTTQATQPAEPFDGYAPNDECDSYTPAVPGLWDQVAPIESTGTWLRRGFWYAEADAVVWNRLWNRDDHRLASEDPNVNDPRFFDPRFIGVLPLAVLTTNRLLILQGANPGQDASVRTTLGQFLFRDSRNRDHTFEFTALGGGDWEEDRVISSEVPFGLFVPFVIDGGNRSFDNSSRQMAEYESHYKSFEVNYRVRQRLGHDQLVMDPNGCWHRAANAGFEREYLAGLRFLELEDKLDWRAEDIVVLGADGRYLIHTNNDLFGFQMGGGLTYQAPRWSLGVTSKGGVFVNDALGRTQLNFTADDISDADLRLRENELSFIGETKLQGKFHVTPNFSLRAAYELMYIESVALAPNQATFITDFSYLNTTGDPLYHGASFGFEGYW